jgi:IS5 family transposase
MLPLIDWTLTITALYKDKRFFSDETRARSRKHERVRGSAEEPSLSGVSIGRLLTG